MLLAPSFIVTCLPRKLLPCTASSARFADGRSRHSPLTTACSKDANPSTPRSSNSPGSNIKVNLSDASHSTSLPDPDVNGARRDESHDSATFDEIDSDTRARSPWLPGKRSEASTTSTPATELIFNLYNRGSGWGEEIVPHVTVQQRKIQKLQLKASDPWEEGSVERMLQAAGVSEDKIGDVLTSVTAWRVTKQGRSLVDKRRRRRVQFSIPEVVELLVTECDIAYGPKGTGALITRFPHILLCKIHVSERFGRRAVELAAFIHKHGHCQVPSTPEYATLTTFVKRTQSAMYSKALSEEQIDILNNLQFNWGTVVTITPEWDIHFAVLHNWLLVVPRQSDKNTWWKVTNWNKSRIECQLAAWVQLQRELYRTDMLCADAVTRLNSIGIVWEEPYSTAEELDWLSSFSQLAHIADRTRASKNADAKRVQRPEKRKDATLDDDDPSHEGLMSIINPAIFRKKHTSHRRETPSSHTAAVLPPVTTSSLTDVPMPANSWIWLQRQRVLWYTNRLPRGRVQLLYAAGVELNPYSPPRWREQAHLAACHLNASNVPIPLGPHAKSSIPPKDEPVTSQTAATRRWVRVQIRMALEGRLFAPQREYIFSLALGWILSAPVLKLGPPEWMWLYSACRTHSGADNTASHSAHRESQATRVRRPSESDVLSKRVYPVSRSYSLACSSDASGTFYDVNARTSAISSYPLNPSTASTTRSPAPPSKNALHYIGRSLSRVRRKTGSGSTADVSQDSAMDLGLGVSAQNDVLRLIVASYRGSVPKALDVDNAMSQVPPSVRFAVLEDWLHQQRGLSQLGWLPAQRQQLLDALFPVDHGHDGGGCESACARLTHAWHSRGDVRVVLQNSESCGSKAEDRPPSDEDWGSRIGDLMSHRRRFGHVKVAAGGEWQVLYDWLAELAAQSLRPSQIHQLRAIGVDANNPVC